MKLSRAEAFRIRKRSELGTPTLFQWSIEVRQRHLWLIHLISELKTVTKNIQKRVRLLAG